MIEPPDSIEGLMDPAETAWLASRAGDVLRRQAIIEVGSYRGLSSSWLAAGARVGYGARVTCIDTWPDPRPNEPDLAHAERQRGALAAFRAGMVEQDWPVTALRARGHDIAESWMQPVGLFFHDADHSLAAVVRDYLAWEQHFDAYCWVALHDYLGEQDEPTDVARAVNEVILPRGEWRDVELVRKMWVGCRVR